jgi:regulator of cell morphogenesis and NO signaling
MEADHVRVGRLATRLRTLTNDFLAPADGCATYRLCYGELETFEQDLHRHVHLENNILFPRAIEIERSLM